MSTELFDLARIVALVADALEDTLLGGQTLEAHSGTTPDVLRAAGVGPVRLPPAVLQMRRAIGEIRATAEILVSGAGNPP